LERCATVVFRFELWVRETCPYPYADADDALAAWLTCEPGPLRSVVTALVYSARVDDLTPYTGYEFLLSVDNEAGSVEQPVSTHATTLPAGKQL